MKIILFYTYNQSFLSSFFKELALKLTECGYVINIVSLKEIPDFLIITSNLTVTILKKKNRWRDYISIFNLIKSQKPDVIISNFSYVNPAIICGRLLGVKRNIAWFHTAFGHAKPNKLKVWNKSVYLNMADVVLANSKVLQNEIHSVYRVSKAKTRRIPFWTNITKYSSNNTLQILKNNEVLNMGCPGRLVADKNHALVIKTVYQLKRSHEQTIRLYIAGDGPYRKQLELLVKNLNLEKEVVFLGLLDVEKMTAFYEAMNVVVLPSFHEAFGLVFIEAIALGTPVLVSNAFGALDFIDSNKFPMEDFSFNPHKKLELIDKLEPYLNKAGKTSDYFKNMYAETFEKEMIYNQVKAVILNQTPIRQANSNPR